MFRKRKPEPQARQAAKPTVKLTTAEKREISRILETARGDGKVHSAQDTLPFRQMYPDGLCKLDDHTWSKCIEFEDVNYQLAKPDDQTAIFEALCDMYNAHDASIGIQLSLVSRRMNRDDFVKRIEIAAQEDHFDHIRELYTQMLRKQLERGNNGLIKTKYLTLTIEARDSKTARARFSRIVMDALNHFKVMGALAKELGGKEWLEILHGILHPDGERFAFEWSWLAPSGLSVQDFIAPSSFRFGEARKFTMADKFCAVSFLQISAPEMDDRMLTELLDTDSGLLVSLHIRSMDQNEAIKTVKRKITDIDSMKIDAQKKAVREGFDMDIIPTDLATYAGEAKNILRDLQSRNERMFLMTFLVVNFADSKQKLENDLLRAASVAQKYNCSLVRLDFQQEDGFVSALPLGVNRIKIQRGLTTSAVAVFVPFTTQEIFHGGEALYYGLNATSGNMILADRKKLKTPNGMILGTPGSGKSFSAKRSIVGVFLNTKDDILICDPEAEYFPLVNRLEGQVIKISPTSTQYVNPMDINLNYSEDDNPLALKSDFILSFCELAAGGRNGLEPVEKTVIDRAVRIVYRPYIADPRPENMPLLEDLYDEIKRQPEPEAQRIAAALELYVHGSLNVFNHRTNVDINNRILTQTVEVEVRYRTETRTDSEGNDYDVEVPYNYYICKVKLENFDLSHVPVYIMDEETLSLYAVYMETLGNREDLFPGSGYVDKYTKPPTTYDIPPSALEDETFAALITEAEKYIGYPYVWGGSNPNTSFDCSGFVSWTLTQSGVCNTGRLGAQGLYNISTPVSSANARPGDLIFFVGTYDTPGVSHVGIYVGGGKMLHCGDPIQYADINTSYWQSHFYAFGRPPYN